MTMDFRSRSADVRREATDILWRFRSSRAARRAGSANAGGAGGQAAAATSVLPVSPATEELIRAARETPRPVAATFAPSHDALATPADDDACHMATVADAAPAAEALTVPLVPSDPVAATDPVAGDEDDPVLKVDLPGDTAEVPDTPNGVWPTDEPPEAAETPDPSADDIAALPTFGPETAEARELSDLPGVGAGLVWLLGRCGVHTLHDLAHADAERLEQELGLVGQLLDLPSWIDLARQTVATERMPTP
ncbi:MAG: hypothetical protein MUF73_02835 [Rhodobacteraceae bacterium]|jgi:predicted flap endonuclease-1-like 5' DNA nuclease|nr:hypothetical protein [Paracoccaceae bacterium]